MSQRGASLGKRDGKDFRWPPSNYNRLLAASAVGYQMRPPAIGSAATRCDGQESGHDFPSLIASDVSTKAAVSEGSISRRVRFSDEGLCGDVKESSVRLRHSGKVLKSSSQQVHSSQLQAGSKPIVATRPMRSAIKAFKSVDKLDNVETPIDSKGASKSMASNESALLSAASGNRIKSTSESNRVTSLIKVRMNKAAIKRHDYIRQRLRDEWFKYKGDLKTCPFL